MGGKTLLLAEKPDQARSFYVPMLERVTGETFTKNQGFYSSKNYYVSWFFGHILAEINPDEYDEKYKRWNLDDLPIIPESLLKKYKDKGCEEQGRIILRLANECETVVCGTDPDREGQLIFDNFFEHYKIKRPKMYRLWAPSLTDKDLDRAWSRMKELSEYSGLSLAAKHRSLSDWLVGINSTRAYRIITKTALSVGRVITPTLALIVNRDKEVEDFKEAFFYQLKGTWSDLPFLFYDGKESKFEDEAFIKGNYESTGEKKFSLSEFKEEEKTENPPKPFSLPELQKEANRVFGYKLDRTLELAQELYEKKALTYPRTDSPYLPASDLSEYHSLVRGFATEEQAACLLSETQTPVCVKDTDSPHTALIITGEKPRGLSVDQQNIYDLVKNRFIVSFMLPRKFIEYNITIMNTSGDGSLYADTDGFYTFKTRVIFDIDLGYKKYLKSEDAEDEPNASGSRLNREMFHKVHEVIKDLFVDTKKRSKPKHYTPAALITAMQTCGRNLNNDKYKRILSELKGIGTPATQSTFPKKLEELGLIISKKGSYVSTPKGRALVELVSESLKTPELTAEWELKLRLVESGELEAHVYRQDLIDFVCGIVNDTRGRKGAVIPTGKETKFLCSKCRKRIFELPKLFVCEDNICGFKMFKDFWGVSIPNIVINCAMLIMQCLIQSSYQKKIKTKVNKMP